jgi:hypothetical protein
MRRIIRLKRLPLTMPIKRVNVRQHCACAGAIQDAGFESVPDTYQLNRTKAVFVKCAISMNASSKVACIVFIRPRQISSVGKKRSKAGRFKRSLLL